MNKEEIIALAEEKGACTHREHWELYPHRISFGPDELFDFAKAIQKKQLPIFQLLGDGLRIDMNYLCLNEKRSITQHVTQAALIHAIRADQLVNDTCAQMYSELCKPIITNKE